MRLRDRFHSTLGVFVLMLVLLAGCGEERAYVVSALDVRRTGWDSLSVDVAFAEETMMGRHGVSPESTAVYLFGAAYDTLYAGPDAVIAVPDSELGDGERLMVEVCGQFDGQMVCGQDAVLASPKRIRLEHDISYPDDGAYEQGSYDLQFVVERQAFDSDEEWEPVDRRDTVYGYLLAYVGGRQDGTVKVPFKDDQGRFDLKRYAGYRDFQYYLKSKLMDEREARVRFDVYAGLDKGALRRVATVEKRVREKTPEERADEVRYFAEQATDKILEHLGVDEDDRRARAYIDEWTFDERTHTYSVEMEIGWGGGYFFGQRYQLYGVLEVDESGATSSFRLRDASRRAERLWRDEVRGRVLTLGVLEPMLHDADAEFSANETRRRGVW